MKSGSTKEGRRQSAGLIGRTNTKLVMGLAGRPETMAEMEIDRELYETLCICAKSAGVSWHQALIEIVRHWEKTAGRRAA